MKKKFNNKNLLILGSNVGVTDIIKYAKENGAKTIVADYYNEEKSIAKQISDFHEEVSTDDIDGLIKVAKKYNIDGVISGISEFNLLKANELCDILNLNNYFNLDQWNKVANKDTFRKMCNDYNVSCPKTLYTGKLPKKLEIQNSDFPVVVKPVDGSMSRGVTICSKITELDTAITEAINNSNSKKLIIEEYFEGDEFTAHYSIVNGHVNLACMDNRYPVAVNSGKVTTIPIARVFPSTFLDKYLSYENKNVIKMIESLNLKNGIFFLQGFYNIKKDKFCIFEAGLRCAGEAPYRFIEKVNGLNFLKPIVDLSLGVKTTDYDYNKEDPYLDGKCCGVVSFVTKGGTVGKIVGLKESVSNINNIIEYECRYKEGEVSPSGNTLRQLMIRFVMICDNINQMKSNISYLNNNINVFDINGTDMVLKFDQNRLNDEFIIL